MAATRHAWTHIFNLSKDCLHAHWAPCFLAWASIMRAAEKLQPEGKLLPEGLYSTYLIWKNINQSPSVWTRGGWTAWFQLGSWTDQRGAHLVHADFMNHSSWWVITKLAVDVLHRNWLITPVTTVVTTVPYTGMHDFDRSQPMVLQLPAVTPCESSCAELSCEP